MGWDEALRDPSKGWNWSFMSDGIVNPHFMSAFQEFYLRKQESDNLWPTPESIQYQQDLLIQNKQQKCAHNDHGNNNDKINNNDD